MPKTVLPHLETVASSLEAEETALAAQLSKVRAKRDAILSVIELFQPPSSESLQSSAESSVSAVAEASTSSAELPVPAVEKKTTIRKPKGKRDGRASSWQKYTLPDFNGQSMPEAVRHVLSTEPGKEFKIADVMSVLFKDSMPKSQYLKARNRISGILSNGFRDGDFFRGEGSTYKINASVGSIERD
jgi:hypothetical protein